MYAHWHTHLLLGAECLHNGGDLDLLAGHVVLHAVEHLAHVDRELGQDLGADVRH
jgi:hypothetical protein